MIQTILLSILLLCLAILCINFFTPRLEKSTHQKQNPLVSILIPCRNEESNIQSLIKNLKQLTHKNIEIIFLDDNSSDKTGSLLKKDKVGRIITGKPLPEGWIGKNWACHQLSKQARGDYLLFIDADVRLSKNSIQQMLSFQGVVTVFPKYTMKTIGEYLTVPVIHWFLLTFLVIPFANWSYWKSTTAAVGQIMLFSRKDYDKIGGHASIKSEIVDDIKIAKLAKKNRIKVNIVLSKLCTCRPYNNFKEAISGFSKNMYSGIGNPINFILFLGIMIIVFLNPKYWYLILIHAILERKLANQPYWTAILHPLQMIIWSGILINSFFKTISKTREWKGRKY